jgi:hypothetical protein
MVFLWDRWNREHVSAHGVSQDDAVFVVRNVSPPFPEPVGNGKHRVCGTAPGGRLIQVIFAFSSPERMNYEEMTYDDIVRLESGTGPYVYIVHARSLTPSEKRGLNKRRR